MLLAALIGASGVGAAAPAGYSSAVTRICSGALLFNGRHEIGNRAGAIAVSRDIRATGNRRLRRVDAVPKPKLTTTTIVRWLGLERALVEMYSANYLRIWTEIERADTPRERAALPARLRKLIREPVALERKAHGLESALRVPDCTGGGPR